MLIGIKANRARVVPTPLAEKRQRALPRQREWGSLVRESLGGPGLRSHAPTQAASLARSVVVR